MDNSSKYVKLYEEKAEESLKKWGYYYPPRTWEEFYAWEDKTFEKYLKEEENGARKTKSYVGLLDTIKDFGLYYALRQTDYETLNNVLYQISRLELLDSGMTASGTDHCNALLDATSAFACNDFEIIDHFFPKNLPYSQGKYYTEISVNLLRVLYYKEFELQTEVIQKANKFLNKKITLWEQYVILYFLSLVNRNIEETNKCLQELCAAYQKIGYPKDKLDKCFASEIHGLYRFARLIDEVYFSRISRPKHPCFFEEFEIWQQNNNYPKGKLFYKYPEKMDYMNKIFEAELPFITLHAPYPDKKDIYKDVDQFAKDLTENISREIKTIS